MPRIRRGRHTRLTITFTPEERQTLQAWLRGTVIAAGKARRGRMILLLAAGMPITRIAHAVGISRRFVYKWVARFQAQGVAGLYDRPRRSACPRTRSWATAGRESQGDDAGRVGSAKSPLQEPLVASVQSGATKGRLPSAPAVDPGATEGGAAP